MIATMHAPWINMAYEKLQADLEQFLSERYADLNVKKTQTRKDFFGEKDLYKYEIFKDGRKLGEVLYEWGAQDIVRVNAEPDATDNELFRDVEKAFSNEREQLQKYADEFKRSMV